MDKKEAPEEIRRLQQLELGILLDVAALCRARDIPFFLGEGTLLGAVRHKGFIPWDDDVDILMKREDYLRFLQIAPAALAPRYAVQHFSTVKRYWSPFLKIRLLEDTPFRQTHIAHLTEQNGPYIDVFPLDYLPRDRGIILLSQSCAIRFLRGALSQKLGTHPANSPKRLLLRLAACFLPYRGIHFLLDRLFRLHGGAARPFLGNLASYQPLRAQVVSAKAYAKAAEGDFAGHPMPIPCGWDAILTRLYGDYMQLPARQERVAKHHFGL